MRNSWGLFRSVSLPETQWKPLEEARKRYERHVSEHQALGAELETLAEKRHEAVAADRRALADALDAGKGDPGDQEIRELDARVAAVTRRREALELLLNDQEREIASLFEKHRGQWLGDVEKLEEKARAEQAKALESFLAARAAVDHAVGLRLFVQGYPNATKMGAQFRPLTRPIPNLNVSVEQLAQALRADVEPPAPKKTNPDSAQPLRPRPNVVGGVAGA